MLFYLSFNIILYDPTRFYICFIFNVLYFSTSSPSGPAGSIYSTPKDMGEWILLHLNTGKDSSGHNLVDNATLKETYRGQMATPLFGNLYKPRFPISDAVISYNMGWLSSVYRGMIQ